jgi:hypothetical protein
VDERSFKRPERYTAVGDAEHTVRCADHHLKTSRLTNDARRFPAAKKKAHICRDFRSSAFVIGDTISRRFDRV